MYRDSGLPSRAENSHVANRLAKTVAKSVQDKLAQWTDDNFTYYQQAMDLIREGAPVQWVKLYHEAIKLGLEKSTNINININRQQDRENLQALVRARIPSLSSPASVSVSSPSECPVHGDNVAVLNSPPTFTPYIEVPSKKEEEQ